MNSFLDKIKQLVKDQGVIEEHRFCNVCNVDVTKSHGGFCWSCGCPEYRIVTVTVCPETGGILKYKWSDGSYNKSEYERGG